MAIDAWFSTGTVDPRQFLEDYCRAPLRRGCSVALCTYGRPVSVARFLDSLATQHCQPEELVIVDASEDAETERSLRARGDLRKLAQVVTYVRVRGPLKGLTRQRNLALRVVGHDLVAFFDDDIVLRSGALCEMKRPHRSLGEDVAGVAARLESDLTGPTALARLYRRLRLISTLRPGSYCRSGMIVPWEFLDKRSGFVEGEWLYGGATMWRTQVARTVGFAEELNGYGLGEDLEFSLRARRLGKVGVAAAAVALHLHDHSSRPDPFTLGYMEILNRYRIQRRALANRSRADGFRFAYAWAVDTLLLVRDFRFRTRQRAVVKQICGRFKGAFDASRLD